MRMRRNRILAFLMTIAMLINLAPLTAVTADGAVTINSDSQMLNVETPEPDTGEADPDGGEGNPADGEVEYLPAGEFRFEGWDYTVVFAYGDDALLPVGTELKVREIYRWTQEYRDLTGITTEYVENDWSEIDDYMRFFDITLMLNGEEIEPQGEVQVSIDFKRPIDMDEETSLEVLHIDGENNIESVSTEVRENDESNAEAVSFTSGSFSVYGVVRKREIITKTLPAANGSSYEIVVEYGQNSGILDTSEIRAEEISEGSEAYEAYLQQIQDTIGSEGQGVQLFGLYDISIWNGDEKVIPDADVKVSIRLLNQEADPSEESVRVIHFEGEEETPVEIENCSVDGNVVSFNTDGFSVFAIAYTVDFYYGEFEYHLDGGGAMALSELFALLNIDRNVEDVESVSFTDPSLISVSKVEEDTTVGALIEELGLVINYSAELSEEEQEAFRAKELGVNDWALISLQRFLSHEILTISFSNGDTIDIQIEDATEYSFKAIMAKGINDQIPGYLWMNSGDNGGEQYTGTTYNGKVPLNIKIKNIQTGYHFVTWVRDDDSIPAWYGGSSSIPDYIRYSLREEYLSRDMTYFCYFAPDGQYLIRYIAGEHGRIDNGNHYVTDLNNKNHYYSYSSEGVFAHATADWGYAFDGWYVGDTKISSDTTLTLSDITSDTVVTAKFKPAERHTITYISNYHYTNITVGSTTVYAGNNGIAYALIQESLYDGDSAKGATAATHANFGDEHYSYFIGWFDEQGTLVCNQPRFVPSGSQIKDTTYIAVFSNAQKYTVVESDSQYGTVGGSYGLYNYSLDLTTANTATNILLIKYESNGNMAGSVWPIPNEGYTFDHWELDGVPINDNGTQWVDNEVHDHVILADNSNVTNKNGKILRAVYKPIITFDIGQINRVGINGPADQAWYTANWCPAVTVNGAEATSDENIFTMQTGYNSTLTLPALNKETRVTITTNNNGYNLLTHYFKGWKADRDIVANGTTYTAGTLIPAGTNIPNVTEAITFTAVWSSTFPGKTEYNGGSETGPRYNTNSVGFFVRVVDNEVNIGNTSFYTPCLFTTRLFVEGSGSFAGSANGSRIDYFGNGSEPNFDIIRVIDQELRAGASSGLGYRSGTYQNQGQTYDSTYSDTRIRFETFPSDELIFSRIRAWMGGSNQIVVNGMSVPSYMLTSDNFEVRWYVLKDQENQWHVDGMLIPKFAKLVVKKTFIGADDVVAAAKDGYQITVTSNNQSPSFTLSLGSGAQDGVETHFDVANNEYTWVLTKLSPLASYTVTEQNYTATVDGVTYNTRISYQITNTPQSTTSGTSATANVEHVYSYADSETYPSFQTVAFANLYTRPFVMTILKKDGTTLRGLANATFDYVVTNTSNNQVVLDTHSTSDANGQITIEFPHNAGTYTFTLNERPREGYNALATITGTATVSNSGVVTLSNVIATESGENALVSVDESDPSIIYVINTPERKRVVVTKKWTDGTNTPVTMQLLRNGVPVSGESVVLRAPDWTYTWNDLPAYVDGREVFYSVREEWIGEPGGSDSVHYNTANDTDGYTGYIVSQSQTETVEGDLTTINIYVENTEDNGQVIFSKLNTAQQAVSGAVFAVYEDLTPGGAPPIDSPYAKKTDGKNAVYTSDSNGIVTVDGLAAGWYWIREIQAPAGYSFDPEDWYILEIKANNSKMYAYDEQNPGHAGVDLSKSVLSVINPPILTTTITVNKVWSDGNDNHTDADEVTLTLVRYMRPDSSNGEGGNNNGEGGNTNGEGGNNSGSGEDTPQTGSVQIVQALSGAATSSGTFTGTYTIKKDGETVRNGSYTNTTGVTVSDLEAGTYTVEVTGTDTTYNVTTATVTVNNVTVTAGGTATANVSHALTAKSTGETVKVSIYSYGSKQLTLAENQAVPKGSTITIQVETHDSAICRTWAPGYNYDWNFTEISQYGTSQVVGSDYYWSSNHNRYLLTYCIVVNQDINIGVNVADNSGLPDKIRVSYSVSTPNASNVIKYDPRYFIASAGEVPALGNSSEMPSDYVLDESFTRTVTLNRTNGWQQILTGDDLLISDSKGNTYYYAIVEEQVPTGYSVSYSESQPVGATLGGISLTATNTLQIGSVQVTKTFSGISADQIPADFQIVAAWGSETRTLKISGMQNYEDVVLSGSGLTWTWTINNIVVGTAVTFTESGYDLSGYTVTATANPVTGVSAATPVAASFTNTYTLNPGTLEITKAVTDDSAVPVDTVFTFEVELKNADDSAYTGNVTVTDSENNAVSVAVASGKVTVTVEGTGTATIANIPAGTKYTVTEPEKSIPVNWRFVEPAAPEGADGVISPNETETVTVTNESLTAIYAVKAWTQGNPKNATAMTAWPEGKTVTFQLQYNAADEGEEENWKPVTTDAKQNEIVDVTVSSLEAVVFNDLPNGVTYRVAEIAIDGETLETPVIATGTGTEDDPFTVTNTVETFISIEKVWNNQNSFTWPENVSSVTIGLFNSETATEPMETVTLTASKTYEIIEHLPVYDVNGAEIPYFIKELYVTMAGGNTVAVNETDPANPTVTINGSNGQQTWNVYNGPVADNTATVTNSIPTAQFVVKKEWIDVIDTSNMPAIHFALKYYIPSLNQQPQNAQVYPNCGDIILNNANNWTWSIELPEKMDGRPVLYFVEEKLLNPSHPEVDCDYGVTIPDNLAPLYAVQLVGYANSYGVQTQDTFQQPFVVAIGNVGTITIRNRAPSQYMQMDIKKKFLEWREDQPGVFSLWTVTSEDYIMRNLIIEVQVLRRYIDERGGQFNYVTDWIPYGNTIFFGYTANGTPYCDNNGNLFPVRNAEGTWHFIIPNSGQNEGLPRRGFEIVNNQLTPVRYQYILKEVAVYDGNMVKQDAEWASWLPYAWDAIDNTARQIPVFPLDIAQDQDRFLNNTPATALTVIKEWSAPTNVREVYVKIFRTDGKVSEDFTHVLSEQVAYPVEVRPDYFYGGHAGILDTQNEWIILKPGTSWSATIHSIDINPGMHYTIQEVGYMDADGNVHTSAQDVSVFSPVSYKWSNGAWVPQGDGLILSTPSSQNKLKVTNTVPGVEFTPEAEKLLNGKAFNGKLGDGEREETFTFELKEMTVATQDGQTTYTISDEAIEIVDTSSVDGSITFSAITFRQPGTYYYQIEEQGSDTDTMDYQGEPVYLKVVVDADWTVTAGYYEDQACTRSVGEKATFRNTELTVVDVTKVWSSSAGGNPPEGTTVTLSLYAGTDEEAEPISSVTLDGTEDTDPEDPTAYEDSAWHAIWKRLPKYDAEGAAIEYVVRETSGPDGYTVTYSGEGTPAFVRDDGIITNTLNETDIIILKVNEDGTKALTGAKFQLQKQKLNEETQEPEFVDEGDVFEITNTDGTYKIEKLTDGTYRLVEKQAPAGYITLGGPIEFSIVNGEVVFTNEEGGMVRYDKEDNDPAGTFTVKNTPGAELPATGGPGTMIYTASGLLLIALAGLLLARRRKYNR